MKKESTGLESGVVIVTGGGSGIGQIVAESFGERGADVVVADIDASAAEQTAKKISAAGGSAIAISCDVADENSVESFRNELMARHGRADVLVNVAGIFDRYIPAPEMPLDLWQQTIAVNLTGTFLMARAVIPAMASQGAGAIINTSSICGLVGGAGGVAYTASKHGVIGLTRQLADEWGPSGVRVNAICPGVIGAGMTLPHIDAPEGVVHQAKTAIPARRLGTGADVANLAIFLASDAASYIHGAAVPVDGGWTAL